MKIKKKYIFCIIVLSIICLVAFKINAIAATDTTLPTVTISGIASGLVVDEGGTITFKIYFDDETELASTYVVANSILTNGFTATKSITGGAVKTVTLSNIKGAGTGKSVTIIAGVAKDSAGNSSKAVTSRSFTIKSNDQTVPKVSISSPNPTSVYGGETVKYTVYFDDETGIKTVNFNKDYVVLNGFTAAVSISGSGNEQRTVTLTNVQGATDSDNYITVKAGAVTDTSSNTSKAVSSTKFTIAKRPDTTIPTVTISSPNPTSVYGGETVKYTVYFDDETGIKAVNFNKDYVVLNGFTATVSVTGTGNTRIVTLTNVQGATDSDNYITVKAGAVTDTSSNTSKAVSSTKFTIAKRPDTTIPTVTISKPVPNNVYIGETIKYTVYFDDETGIKAVNFNKDYVVLNGFTATVSISGSGNEQRTVTLTNVQGATDSDNYITVKAGAVTDTSSNTSKAVSSAKFTMMKVPDKTIPTVVISEPNPASIYAGETVKYTVYFDDDKEIRAINFNKDYVVLNGFTATVSVSGSGNEQRTVTLTNVQGTADSDNYITVKAGAVMDSSGNVSKLVNSTIFTIKEIPDTMLPTVSIDKAMPAGIYAGESVIYTVRFSDETKLGKIHFDESYVVLNGFTANIAVSGTGKIREVLLTNVQGVADYNNYITVKAGAAEDAAGNETVSTNSKVFTILEKAKDTIAPVVKISAANPKSVYAGGTVKYTVTFTDNVKVTDVNLIASKIELVGFTADVSVKVDGVKSAIVTLKNIKGNAGINKYIKIASGVALDEPGNRSAQAISPKFSIVKKTSTIVGTNPTVTKYITNCIDDLSLLGDINKEITYFASWLRAEKYTATHVQENNYVAENETMTYMVEYYNGSAAPSPDVKFDLTIPYKVIVEEINGNGKITKQTETETVITWNVGTVPSYAASQGRGYCRLYVRVSFLENEALEKSNNISETFYATLKTTADGNHSYSYMRQLFIDTTEGKTGTYKSYLTTVDTTNQVRPDDEITRAEFAKLLADSGILDVKVGSNDYKTFKDHEKIPSYARDGVSALVKTDIIQAFADGEFKPNHPILMEDAMQMIAQAATYISEQKLTVYKPVFLYTDALTGTDKKISPKKDYIMELMRQNVVVKYESKPNTYALRKDVVVMINSLTFRGPYVEKLPENTLKFADIREDSVFFYNVVGASNSYKYTYDYRLWQQVVEII